MGDGRRWLDALDVAAVVLLGVGVSIVLHLAGLPSPALFGGLAAGLGRALAGRRAVVLPEAASTLAQAVIGVMLGALLQAETLVVVAENWLAVLLVTVGTLAISVAAGQLLRLQPGISPVTGAAAMIAGGASNITVIAQDLGADPRMVAVLQYLRVLLIVISMPIAASALAGVPGGGASAVAGDTGSGWLSGLGLTVGCAAVGLVVGRLARIPQSALFGPMLAAIAVDLSGWAAGATVPDLVIDAAFLAIGLQVGLTFTVASLRLVGRALPIALTLIVGVILACAGLGLVLSVTTGVRPLDAYLATTPGGMNAVLATATDIGADTTFVLAVQVLRLFVMLLSAPLLAWWLRRGAG